MKYRVLIDQDEDGIFIADVMELPGCTTQGKTREEAMANAKEAIAVYLESLEAHGDSTSQLNEFFLAVSQSSLDKIWNNTSDDVYEKLLEE